MRQMISPFLQIHQLKLNFCCIKWNMQQVASVSIWTQMKQSGQYFNQDGDFSLNGKLLKFVD